MLKDKGLKLDRNLSHSGERNSQSSTRRSGALGDI